MENATLVMINNKLIIKSLSMQKKIRLLLLFVILGGFSAGAQMRDASLRYNHGKIYDPDGHRMHKSDVKYWFGEPLYYSTYKGARKQYVNGMNLVKAGIINSVIGAAGMGAGVVLENAGEFDTDTNAAIYAAGCILLVSADICLSIGIPLAAIGKGRLKWMVDDYNENGGSSKHVSLNIGPCRYGYGLALNF